MQVEDFFKESVSILRERNLDTYNKLPPHKFTPEFEKNMQIFITNQRHNEIKTNTGLVWKQAFCFIFVTILILCICFISIGEWSKEFLTPPPIVEIVPKQQITINADDIVFYENGDIENLEKLNTFVTAYKTKQNSKIRLVHFAADKSTGADKLEILDGKLYYTIRENTREEYDSIGILTNGGTNVLLLYSTRYDKPTEVARYKS